MIRYARFKKRECMHPRFNGARKTHEHAWKAEKGYQNGVLRERHVRKR